VFLPGLLVVAAFSAQLLEQWCFLAMLQATEDEATIKQAFKRMALRW
jgi:hypothetical protein